MKRSADRLRPVRLAFTGLFVGAGICAAGEARGQTQPPAQGGSKASAKGQNDRPSASGKADRRAADDARAKPARNEPSAAYQESVRQTVERRRARRARRQQNGGGDVAAVGAIVIWPMPPTLIIRQTPEVHREVDSLLYGLRR
jgi:hypothetical protein